MGAHTTTDDPTRYRVASELEAWKLKDPIERVKAYLFKNELADQAFIDTVEAEADQLGADLRRRCLAMPDPPPLAIFDHVYREPHALIDEERATFAAYLEGFES
jgi:pyruvate dehydrogenase E1 component alpha subunit